MVLLNEIEVARLRELGLDDGRIQHLDNVLREINKALPDDRQCAGAPPANVRRTLELLGRDANLVASRLKAILDAAATLGSDQVAAEAGAALLASASMADIAPEAIDALPQMLSGLAQLAESARSSQSVQRRDVTPWTLVQQIREVVAGVRDSRGSALQVSAAEESTFVQVVAVVFEALGLSHSPRRAVQNYLDFLQAGRREKG